MATTNTLLAELILAWAKEHKPEAYALTLGVSQKPTAFRNYLLRLIELRCEAEPDFRLHVPMTVLEETSVVMKFKIAGQEEIEVKGAKVGGSRDWSFLEIANALELGASALDLITMARAKRVLDLEVVEPVERCDEPKGRGGRRVAKS